jgi:hypothetical protein
METQNRPNKPLVPNPWQPRFGTRAMLLLMLVSSVMAAGGYYLVQALKGGRQFQLVFILFTLASPLLIMVIVSLAYAFFGSRPRNKR